MRGYTYLMFLFSIYAGAWFLYWQWHPITYFLRPIWGTPPRPFKIIPHFYAQNVSMEALCKLHGWELRSNPRRVFDAVIFNNEVDILELRWRELEHVITKFVLLESNGTFTGLAKPKWFDLNRDRFKFAENKLHYETLVTPTLRNYQSPFEIETFQRDWMNLVLRRSGIKKGDLLIMSDADEIPSAHTVELLRNCDVIPEIIHMQLREYIYSFEFPYDYGSWKSSIHVYGDTTRYGHYHRLTDHLLADSGWHCSFCFRTISEITFKMRAYSHAKRIKKEEWLDNRRVQDYLCKGKNIYDMLPEEFTFKELIGKMGGVPSSYSGVNLPSFLLNNAEKFKFLLPGNCIRQEEITRGREVYLTA